MFTPLLELEADGPGRYRAPVAPESTGAMFGGQFLAQGLMAVLGELDPGWDVNSLHAYFLRPGDVTLPVDLEVAVIRDGRSFATREVVASQEGRERFRMLVSLKVGDDTPRYVAQAAPAVPPPASVTTTYEAFTLAQLDAQDWDGSARSMDILYVNPPGARGTPVCEPQLMWMRIAQRMGDEPAIHRAGLAYLSDSTLVDHIVLPHGLRWQDEDFIGTSLDHAMWFQRPARADEWLLFEQRVEATGDGRGLARGSFYDRAGALVAVCMQEGLMRWQD